MIFICRHWSDILQEKIDRKEELKKCKSIFATNDESNGKWDIGITQPENSKSIVCIDRKVVCHVCAGQSFDKINALLVSILVIPKALCYLQILSKSVNPVVFVHKLLSNVKQFCWSSSSHQKVVLLACSPKCPSAVLLYSCSGMKATIKN